MGPSTEFERLARMLARWDGRRRLQDAVLWLPRGLLLGLLLAALVATLARLRPFLTNDEVAAVAGVLALLSLLLTAALLLLQRRSLLQQARFADAHFQLQERTSTAVEIHSGQLAAPAPLAQQQLADSLQAAERVNVAELLPIRLQRRDILVALLATALLVLAIFLPNPQEEILRGQRALARQIKEEAAALEALREEIAADPSLTAAQREALQEPLTSALQELQQDDLSREQAVAALSAAEAELRELSASNSTEALRRRLESAGEPLAGNGSSRSLGQALQSGDLAQAAASAAQLADELPTLTEAEQEALAQDLAEAASILEGVDAELAQELSTAAAALRSGDEAAAQQALQEASGTLRERAQQEGAAQQAAAAAGRAGQGRQAVAQAGQGAGQQAGQGQAAGRGSSQGQSSGQGSGQGQGQGSGQGNGQGQGQGQGAGQGQGLGNGSGTGTGGGAGGIGGETGHAERLYVPDFADLSGEPGEDVALPAECVANPDNCGGLLNERATEFGDERSRVPYDQVFGDYRDAAYEALDEDYVPLGMKNYVRDYFSSLEP